MSLFVYRVREQRTELDELIIVTDWMMMMSLNKHNNDDIHDTMMMMMMSVCRFSSLFLVPHSPCLFVFVVVRVFFQTFNEFVELDALCGASTL